MPLTIKHKLFALRALIFRGVGRPIAGIASGELTAAAAGREEIGTKRSAGRDVEAIGRTDAATAAEHAAIDAHMRDFGRAIAGVMTGLARSAEDMRGFSLEMNDLSRRGGESLSGAVARVAASAPDLDSVSAAAEQMAESINEITRQVTQVTMAVARVDQRAVAAAAKMDEMARTVEQIGGVARLITEIAGRTDRLVLNATIEAERGGKTTEGTAALAGEAKTLATQTARATEEIAAWVTSVQGAIGGAVDGVRDVAGAIGQVEAEAGAIAAALEQQAAATRDVSDNVRIVSQAASLAVRAMDGGAGAAGRVGQVSQAVLGVSAMIRDTADKVRTEITDFLNAMTRADPVERRGYERMEGAGEMVVIGAAGRQDERCRLNDISLGGGAVHTAVGLPVGTEIRVKLPTGGGVNGRVVSHDDGLLRFTFSQDSNSLGLVGETLARLRATRGVAAG